MRPYLVTLLVVLGSYDGAVALLLDKHCFGGCDLTLDYAKFNDTAVGASFEVNWCQSLLRATSLYLCMQFYCAETGRHDWINEANEKCQHIANTTLPPYNIIANYTQNQLEHVKQLSLDECLTGVVLTEIVVPDKPFVDRASRTLTAAYFEADIHVIYGIAMYYFWALVIAIGVGVRILLLTRIMQRQERTYVPTNDSELELYTTAGSQSTWSLAYTLLKQYIIIPATFGYRCSQNVGCCTNPPRLQSLIISLFVALNIVLCSISYPVFEGNLYWPTVSDQLWRYISDRTGIISLLNFPLIWLFGTRNNVLMWLTGWGFDAYSNFHRWVARVATAQAIVHSFGYTVIILRSGGWAQLLKYWHKHYFWNGALATVSMCVILGFSVYSLRRSHYEIFLVTHIAISIVVLIAMFYHVEIFVHSEWNIYIYVPAYTWLFDRVLRILRILAFSRKFWSTKCSTTYEPSTDIIRLVIPCPQNMLKAKPGTYYYLSVLNQLRFIHQNHPFTLAYVISDKEDNAAYTSSPRNYQPHWTSSSSSTELTSLLPPSPSLMFLIRPYDGFTSRLKLLASETSRPRTLRVLVEGPYGKTQPLHIFKSLLFIVGGTGIAVPLSYLATLFGEESRVLSVHIVWSVRSYALLTEVIERDFRRVLFDKRVTLTAHITQDSELKDDWNGVLRCVDQINSGRPNVYAAVDKAAQASGRGSLAVMACGPAQMADDARRATVCALSNGHQGIEYFEESFKW